MSVNGYKKGMDEQKYLFPKLNSSDYAEHQSINLGYLTNRQKIKQITDNCAWKSSGAHSEKFSFCVACNEALDTTSHISPDKFFNCVTITNRFS